MGTVRMKVASLALDKRTKSPFVLLEDEEGRYALPIYIGLLEANAIAMALEKMKFPRPMTHDLLASTIGALGGTLTRVEVTELRESTFYARLFIETAEGTSIDVDARPSDSIALAVRLQAPIWVQEQVLADARAGRRGEEESAVDKEKWKEFLENLSDDDFGKYKM